MVKVYTNYWENKRDGVRKAHGSYPSEEKAIDGIRAWWEINNNKYSDVNMERTNTGALEITYVEDSTFHYRIEAEEIDGKLPSTSYSIMPKGQIESSRKMNDLDENEYLFDELAEPYRDRLITAMADAKIARQFKYDENGRPITEL